MLSPIVGRYITRQRDRLTSRAVPLSQPEMFGLERYFNPLDLGRVGIVVSDPLHIEVPPFSNIVRWFGFDFPGVELTAAITFDHVIACREPMGASLLFHELVHVVQYRLLGVKAFANCYVHGFLASGSYQGIPLERCAFELEHRFAMKCRAFSVEAAVGSWIEKGGF